jgi:hypothetical protein
MISLCIYPDLATPQTANITDYAIAYKRAAKAQMGDEQATLSLLAAPGQLRAWFESWLGYWLREYESGLPDLTAYTGQIQTMRLFVSGRVYVATLENTWNDIIVAYTTTVGGSVAYKTAANAASIARYGRRTLLFQLDAATGATTAQAVADDMAEALATPQPYLAGFYDPASGSVGLEISALGAAHLLDVTYMTSTTAGNNTLDDEIVRILAEGDAPLRAGSIAVNDSEILKATDGYISLSDRLGDVIALSGPNWYAGCYATVALDYYQADPTAPLYFLDIDARHGPRFYNATTRMPVPDALVRPGQYARVPETDIDLPTSLLIESVTYTPNGLQFTSAINDRLAVLAFNLLNPRTVRKEYIPNPTRKSPLFSL